jgi:hypothetical protein
VFTKGAYMILVIIAALLFVCVGTTGKVVRAGLMNLLSLIVCYLGVPLFAAWLFYIKVSQ